MYRELVDFYQKRRQMSITFSRWLGKNIMDGLFQTSSYSQTNQVFGDDIGKYGETMPRFFEKQMLLAIRCIFGKIGNRKGGLKNEKEF